MKRILLSVCALLALGAPSVRAAAGVNLAWGAGCWTDNPVSAKTFACNTNTGSAPMTASFVTTTDQPDFVGVESVVDLQVDAAALPDWWQFFNAAVCRQTALSTSADFTTAPGGCTDPWAGLAAGGIAGYQTNTTSPPNPNPLPSRARLKVGYAIAAPSPLTAGVQYYGYRATVSYMKSIGTGFCPGCATPATIVLNEIKAAEFTGPFERITDPLTNRCLIWNTSTVPCADVPTRDITWGQIKSLYR